KYFDMFTSWKQANRAGRSRRRGAWDILREFGRRRVVEVESHVLVQLQQGSGHGDVRPALHRLFDDVGLGLAKGEQDDAAGLHHGVYAHGDGVRGHLVDGAEEALVGLARGVRQLDDVRDGGEGRERLVEADVAVVADA